MRNTFLTILFLAISAEAIVLHNSGKVSYDKNSEPDLAGYRIYYGTENGWSHMIDVGDTTEWVVNFSGILQTFYDIVYVAATAYDTAGNESDFSEIVSELFCMENNFLMGDANFDGIVDIEDYAAYQDCQGYKIGQTGFNPILDFNTDGIIDIEDYNILKNVLFGTKK